MLKMSALLVLSILIPFTLFTYSQGCGISIYWGQNRLPDGSYGWEGDLRETCDEGRYKYVNLAFVGANDEGFLVLDLGDHCESYDCPSLGTQISYCQSKGIKVLLSLGGGNWNYTFISAEDAKLTAEDLWISFLGGSPSHFGNVPLDGIDLNIETPGLDLYWNELAEAIVAYSTPERKIYLSAAIGCHNLDTAPRLGYFDYVYVQFYNNSRCDYSGGGKDNVLKEWKLWSSNLPAPAKLFSGLTENDSTSGYIPPYEAETQILPEIRTSANYGGVVLWNRYFDLNSGYSGIIYPQVCENTATINHEDSLIEQAAFK